MKKFEEFLRKSVVIKRYPDKSRANDLMKESDRRLNNLKRIIEKIGIDEYNASDVVEYCYDIILGIIRAKMLLKGFSASGKGAHEAEVSFLEVLNFNEWEIEFVNKLRYFRNGIIYYGKGKDKEYAEKAIKFTNKITLKLKKVIENR